MKLRFLYLAILIGLQPSLGMALTPSGTAQVRQLQSRTIPELRAPTAQTWDLSNGWHVILIEDHSLPLITARVMVRTSSLFAPRDKVGVAGLLMRSLRSGGTLATPPEAMDELLDEWAIRLGDQMGEESATVTMQTLSRHAETAFRHFFEIILTPRFDLRRFEISKKRRLDEIRRQNDIPHAVAEREFLHWLNGDTPWGRIPTRKTLSAVTVEDVRRYYDTHLQHGEKWLVVTGDIRRNQLEQWVTPALPLDPPPHPREALPTLTRETTPGVRIVAKPATQTAIIVGHNGTNRYNPDKYALLVMNGVLGGSPFSNLLVSKIRTERGLAYSVSSNYGFGPKEGPGLFIAAAMTRAEKTGEVVGLIKEIITQIREGTGVTHESVETAKRGIMAATLFEYAEPASIASQQAQFALYGYPANYIQEFRRRIMAVTPADVVRVAHQYLHPDQLRILVVGDPKALKMQLAPFGAIDVVTPSQ
jgi:predicted Zn-dependent peptidase